MHIAGMLLESEYFYKGITERKRKRSNSCDITMPTAEYFDKGMIERK